MILKITDIIYSKLQNFSSQLHTQKSRCSPALKNSQNSGSQDVFFSELLPTFFQSAENLLASGALYQNLIHPPVGNTGSCLTAPDASDRNFHRSIDNRICLDLFFAATGKYQYEKKYKQNFHYYFTLFHYKLNSGDQKFLYAFHSYWHRDVPKDIFHPHRQSL